MKSVAPDAKLPMYEPLAQEEVTLYSKNAPQKAGQKIMVLARVYALILSWPPVANSGMNPSAAKHDTAPNIDGDGQNKKTEIGTLTTK